MGDAAAALCPGTPSAQLHEQSAGSFSSAVVLTNLSARLASCRLAHARAVLALSAIQANGVPHMQLTWEVEALPYAHAASFNGQVTFLHARLVRQTRMRCPV